MIHNLDKTIRTLLHLEMKLGEDQISFEQPTSDWSSRIARSTLNFFLYDVRENNVLRRHLWQNGNGRPGPERQSTLELKRTPLFIDCFYLVTAWSAATDFTKPLIEHELLAKCMLALARYPILNPEFKEQPLAAVMDRASRNGHPPEATASVEPLTRGRMTSATQAQQRAWLNDDSLNLVRDQPYEVYTRIANHDVLTNPSEVWSALENQMKAGFSYVVTLQLDPWASMVQMAEPVSLVEIRTGQFPQRIQPDDDTAQAPATNGGAGGQSASAQAETPSIDDGALSDEIYRVGGVIRNVAVDPPARAAGLQVALMDPELFAKTKHLGIYRRTVTDRLGRFTFHQLQAGEYLVVVGPDITEPLTIENVFLWSNKDGRPPPNRNVLIEIEVELADPAN